MSPTLKRIAKWTTAALLVIFVALQFVPVHRSNPPVSLRLKTSTQVREILERACYDCHSNETTWPWYSHVAPVSWWIVDHVEDGRKHLNFSAWPTFDFEAQDHIFHEIEEQISNRWMPLKSYLRGHPEARLSEDDRRILLEWAEQDEEF